VACRSNGCSGKTLDGRPYLTRCFSAIESLTRSLRAMPATGPQTRARRRMAPARAAGATRAGPSPVPRAMTTAVPATNTERTVTGIALDVR